MCQVKVILRGSTSDTDVFDLNLKVDSGDLTCLDADRNKKAYMRSGLKRSELLHLTKGQFLLVYSILINEVGSFISLFGSEIEEKVFSFGTYTNVLHFSVTLGRLAVTMFLLRQGYKIRGCLVDHHYSHLNKTPLTEIAVESNVFHIFEAVQRYDDFSRASPERVLELSSSRSHEFRDWQATVNRKYQFFEILRLLDENELSQNQFIRYFHYIGLTEYVSDRCFSFKSWEKKHSQLYENIKYTLSVIESNDIKVDEYVHDDEASNMTNHYAWKRQDFQEIYFSTKLSEHDWFKFLLNTELDQIVACIFVKVIFKQWSQLLSHCIGLLTLNSACDDIILAGDADDSCSFFNEILTLIDSRSVDLHISSLIVKSVIESTCQEQIAMEEKDDVSSSLLLELNETSSQFVEMFMSVAPVSQLEQNVRTQIGCLEKLEQLAKFDKSLEKKIFRINGRFTKNFDSLYFTYKKEDGSVLIHPFDYAVEKASLPLLQLLFDKVCVNKFRMFQRLMEHAAYCLQFDILEYLQSTLLAYIERGTISVSTESTVVGYSTRRPLQQIDCQLCAVNAIRNEVLAKWFKHDRFSKWKEGDVDNEFLLVANKAIEFGAVKKGKQWNKLFLTITKKDWGSRDLRKSSGTHYLKYIYQAIKIFFDEGLVDINSIHEHMSQLDRKEVDPIGNFLFDVSFSYLKSDSVGSPLFDGLYKYYEDSIDVSAEEARERIHSHFLLVLELLDFFVQKGWDFMANCDHWISSISELFHEWLNFDQSYDVDGKYYSNFILLEYILNKWDPDIQWYFREPDSTYADGSKQYQAIKHLQYLKSEQRKRRVLLNGIKVGMSLSSIEEIILKNKLILKVRDEDRWDLIMFAALHDRADVINGGMDALKIAIGAGSSAAADTLRSYISTDHQMMLEDNEEKSD